MARPNPRFSSDPSTESGLGTSVSTPKAPSPRATGGTPTTPSSTTAPTKPTTTRKVLTQQEAGQIAQQKFQTQVQALTAPLRHKVQNLKEGLEARGIETSRRLSMENEILAANIEITKIEVELHNIELQNNVNQILQAIDKGKVLVPDYFMNNIAWVKSGAISQQAFLDAYYYLSNQGIIHSAPTEPEIIIEEPIIEEPVFEPEPEITTDQIEPPIEPEPEITTDQVEPPVGVVVGVGVGISGGST